MKNWEFWNEIDHLWSKESFRSLGKDLKQEKEPHRELQGASGWTWRAHRSPGGSGNSDIFFKKKI